MKPHLVGSSCGNHYWVKLMTFSFLHKSNRWVQWDLVGILLSSLMSLVVTLVCIISPAILLWVTIFPGRGSSSGFLWAFSTIINLSLQVRVPMWRFCHLLSKQLIQWVTSHYHSCERRRVLWKRQRLTVSSLGNAANSFLKRCLFFIPGAVNL